MSDIVGSGQSWTGEPGPEMFVGELVVTATAEVVTCADKQAAARRLAEQAIAESTLVDPRDLLKILDGQL